jgi:hypothetical protein
MKILPRSESAEIGGGSPVYENPNYENTIPTMKNPNYENTPPI